MIYTIEYANSYDCGGPALQYALVMIAAHCNLETGEMYVSNKTLQHAIRVKSEKTVRNYIDKLVEKGILSKEPRARDNGSQTTNTITLVGYAEWVQAKKDGVVKITRGGAHVGAPMLPKPNETGW